MTREEAIANHHKMWRWQFICWLVRTNGIQLWRLARGGRSCPSNSGTAGERGGNRIMTDKLKPCPFCGGNAILRQRPDCILANTSMLTDCWYVECINNCVSTQRYRDRIFRQIDGEFFIDNDGRKMAIDAWNGRAGND